MRALAGGRLARALEQLGHDGLQARQRVGDGARLLEDLLLHVVPVGAELGGAAVRLHRAHRALGGAAVLAHHPVAPQLQVDQVALLQVDDLVGDAGQGHGVAGEEQLLVAHAHHQGRASAGADHAVRLVAADDGDGVGALQVGDGGAHRLEQVALVQAVDQVRDDLGVGLAGEVVALGLQRGAQLVVVLDDAVVDQRDAARPVRRRGAGAVAEVRVGVVHRGRAVGGPAGVCDAGGAAQALAAHLLHQLGDALGAARALQAAGVDGHAAGVIAAVLQALQALDEKGDDVAVRDRGDDATHGEPPESAVTVGVAPGKK